MKKLLLLLFFIPCFCTAQTDSLAYKRMQFAGKQFDKFYRAHGASVSVSFAGFAVSGIGAVISNKEVSPVVYVGGGIAFIGFLMSLSSYGHIHDAAKILETGHIGINVPHKKKTH